MHILSVRQDCLLPTGQRPRQFVEEVVVVPFTEKAHPQIISVPTTPSTSRQRDRVLPSTKNWELVYHIHPWLSNAFSRAYSRLSASACQLASMMLLELPTVLHVCSPSLESMSTRVSAAVPASPSTMRTL